MTHTSESPEIPGRFIHRALSWLGRAEAVAGEDADGAFIYLWVAFNAAYAHEFGFEERERDLVRGFVEKLVAVDAEKTLHALLFQQFSGPVRTLVENRFVFEPFWRAMRDHDGSDRWKTLFAERNRQALKHLMGGETAPLLAIVLDRLYVLRNQLIHGGATWNSGVNRQQVNDGVRLMASLVPRVVELLIEHADLDLGGIAYPVVPG